MPYSEFDAIQFAADPDFINWVKHPNQKTDTFWREWLIHNPQKQPEVEAARRIVLALDFKPSAIPENAFSDIWARIDAGTYSNRHTTVFKQVYRRQQWTWATAAAAVLAVCMGLLWLLLPTTKTIETAYAESRTVVLPDSSIVYLSPNSKIRFSEADFSDQKREVSLDGEAYFSVKHLLSDAHFLVHTEELAVEVLGTKFNVNSRRGQTSVVLEEGKVKLDLRTASDSSLTMAPGEKVDFNKASETVRIKQVVTTDYTPWRNDRKVFLGASLAEVADFLSDNYGFTVEFSNEQLKNLTFSGSASTKNPNDVLSKLSALFNLKIQRQADTVRISEVN